MTTPPRLYPLLVVVALFALLVAGCVSDVRSIGASTVSAPQVKATLEYAQAASNALDAAATAQAQQTQATATAQAIEAQSRLDAQYVQATATMQAIALNAEKRLGDVMIDQARAQATAQAVSISATITSINRQSQLDSADAISQTFVISSAALLRSEQLKQQLDREHDWLWLLPDYIVHAAPCGLVVLLLVAGLLIVRALAARLAGDSERAQMVLDGATIKLYLPAPRPSPTGDDSSVSNNTETRYTVTTGNTENDTGNTGKHAEPDVITVNQRSGTSYLPRLTTEQHIALASAKSLCLDWLYRARQWDAENGMPNNYIARHHNLNMKPEDAGDAREMLERIEVVYVKQGGKPKEQGTYIMPDYGTIDNVISLIRSGDIRVSPPGFDDSILKSAAVLDSAIDALPGVTR